VWDVKQVGLAVRVEPIGHKAWKAIYKFQGHKRDYTIGSVAKIGLADARKLAATIMYEVARGKDPQAAKKASRSTGTFDDLADRYLEFAKKRNKSWRQGDALVRKYLRPRLGKLAADNISRSDVRSLVAKISAPVLANQVLASASAVFSFGVKQEIVKLNPCVGVERNKTQSRERRILSDTEIKDFWKMLDAAGMQGIALKMILLTGQRPGEVSNCRWEHLIDGWWEMPGAPVEFWPGTKNGQNHRVWLSAPVQALFEDLDHEG
jgi:integrase